MDTFMLNPQNIRYRYLNESVAASQRSHIATLGVE